MEFPEKPRIFPSGIPGEAAAAPFLEFSRPGLDPPGTAGAHPMIPKFPPKPTHPGILGFSSQILG